MRGKQPTVALIRSHANRSLMIPQVIKVLRGWKSYPQAISVLKKSPEHDNVKAQLSLEQRVEDLEQQVAKMSKLLSKLS